jgi:phage-related protein
MAQYKRKKTIIIDKRADKEIKKFSRTVQLKLVAAFELLEEKGSLKEPLAKKLAGASNLFEIRIRYQGQWRSVFAYLEKDQIIILSAFQKKTQKTPTSEIKKAQQRLKDYE